MKSLLLFQKINVENANAIAGVTYGFPAISNFLGFTHALSRKLQKTNPDLKLDGCAVVCHWHHIHVHKPGGWGDYVFSLTRNPLTKKAKSPLFIEEGRMNLEISMLIECCFDSEDFEEEVPRFEEMVRDIAFTQRIAGGSIQRIERVNFVEVPDDFEEFEKQTRRILLKLLPGFFLVDRTDLLKEHHQNRVESDSNAELIDSWLDFIALKYQACSTSKDNTNEHLQAKIKWERVEKPASGWLVPIATGFRSISPLYENGEVLRTRDPNTPFCFVEVVYSIGQWISPHRIQNIEQVIWRYGYENNWYMCRNNYNQLIQEVNN